MVVLRRRPRKAQNAMSCQDIPECHLPGRRYLGGWGRLTFWTGRRSSGRLKQSVINPCPRLYSTLTSLASYLPAYALDTQHILACSSSKRWGHVSKSCLFLSTHCNKLKKKMKSLLNPSCYEEAFFFHPGKPQLEESCVRLLAGN